MHAVYDFLFGYFFFCALLFIFLISPIVSSTIPNIPYDSETTISYNWKFTREILAPDSIQNVSAIVINGIFPGPTLRFKLGTKVRITVENYLSPHEELSVHWHGISQRTTPWSDGTGSITNCPIPFGRSFTYVFTVEQSGTFWYHLHNEAERGEGGYGMLIVEDNLPSTIQYDEERVLVFADWYHLPSRVIQSHFQQYGNQGGDYWSENGDAILVNGHGNTPYYLDVEANKTYRIRILNAGSLAYLNVAIAGHSMTMLTEGRTLLQPTIMQSLDIAVAQRFDILFTTNQEHAYSYRMALYGQYQGNGTALGDIYNNFFLRYDNSNEISSLQPKNEIKLWNEQISQIQTKEGKIGYQPPAILSQYPQLQPLPTTADSLPNPTKYIIFNVTQQYTNPKDGKPLQDTSSTEGFFRWTVNEMTHDMPNTPLLLSSYYDVMNDVHYTNMTKPYRLEYGDVVQIVIQNQAKVTGECDIHSWHLHGYHVWILGYGEGIYDPHLHEVSLNTINPVVSDTFVSYPTNFTMLRGQEYPIFHRENGFKGCGWTVIRFVADNPGMWHFHCHLDWDMILGMGMVFDVASNVLWENMSLALPKDFQLCGMIDQNTANKRLAKKKTDLEYQECIDTCLNDKHHFDDEEDDRMKRHSMIVVFVISHIVTVLIGMLIGVKCCYSTSKGESIPLKEEGEEASNVNKSSSGIIEILRTASLTLNDSLQNTMQLSLQADSSSRHGLCDEGIANENEFEEEF